MPVADRVRLIDALAAAGRAAHRGGVVRASVGDPGHGRRRGGAGLDRAAARRVVHRAGAQPAGGGAGAGRRGRRARGRRVGQRHPQSEEPQAHARRRRWRRSPGSSSWPTPPAGPVDACVATCFGCPYEGDVDPAVVAGYARRLLDLGADTVFFGDTTGMGSPRRVGLLLDAVEAAGIDLGLVGLHLHDTRGTGLANAYAALERGVPASTPRSAAWAAAPTPPGRRATSPPRTSCTWWRTSASPPGSRSTGLIAAAHLAEEIVGRRLPGQVMRAGPEDPAGSGGVSWPCPGVPPATGSCPRPTVTPRGAARRAADRWNPAVRTRRPARTRSGATGRARAGR